MQAIVSFAHVDYKSAKNLNKSTLGGDTVRVNAS